MTRDLGCKYLPSCLDCEEETCLYDLHPMIRRTRVREQGYNDEDKMTDRIRKLSEAGYSNKDIAYAFDLTKKKVRYILSKGE